MVSKPRGRLFLPLLGVLACLTFSLTGTGQQTNPAQGPPPRVEIVPRPAPPAPDSADALRTNIRVDSTLVLIPVTVTDPMNRFVTGLEKEHFQGAGRQRGSGHFPLRQRGCAAFGGNCLRHQRQHGQQAGQVPAGGGAVLQDRQPGRRVLPGPVQQPPGIGGGLHDRRGGPCRAASRLRNPRAAPRCSTRSIWRFTR